MNLDAIGAIASKVAVPLQVAGGVDGPDQIRLAFAAGATRVVLAMGIVDRPEDLRASRWPATGWPSVSIRGRIASRRSRGAGRAPHLRSMRSSASSSARASPASSSPMEARNRTSSLVRSYDADFLVAGGVHDLDGLRRVRDTGVAGVILGEALLSGAIDYPAALEAAA